MKALFTASLFLFIIFSNALFGQEHQEAQHKELAKHRISILWGNTIVPAGKTAEGEESVLLFPSMGFNYEFRLSKRFFIGWLNEIEVQSYAVEHDNHPDIEREFPIISSVVLIYEPLNNFVVYAGPGIELEKNKNFSIVKMGAEYVIPLPNSFDVSFGVSYELKNNLYDAWTFGVCFGKRFGKVKSQ